MCVLKSYYLSGVQLVDSKAYYVLLSMVDGLGPRRLAALIEFMGTAEKVWYGSEAALRSVPGVVSSEQAQGIKT